MRSDNDQGADYLLLGYVDAHSLELYLAGERSTLELIRDKARLVPTSDDGGDAVPLYRAQPDTRSALPGAGAGETLVVAGAGQGAAGLCMAAMRQHFAEEQVDQRLGSHEQASEWPDEEFADYSEEDLIEATRLAMAELEAGEETP